MKLLRNSAWLFIATAVPTLVSLATVPVYVPAIGAEKYGVLAISWLVLGYFGAADFGIGRAITQRISAMRDEGRARMSVSVWSALVSTAIFGLAGALLVYGSARWYFGGPFEADSVLRSEIIASLWILALCNPVTAINGVLSGALMGLERFRFVSIASIVSSTAVPVFPLVTALWYSTDLPALIMAALAARVLGLLLMAAGVWFVLLRGYLPRISRAEFVRLANFGVWITVSALVGPFMVFADRFVIGAIQDAVAVAAYAIPFQIASRTQILPLAVSHALFPRFAAETGAASQARCRDFTIFVGQFFAPIMAVLICLAEPLLALWLGVSFDARSVEVAHWLLAGFWINAVAQMPYGLIQARGNPRFTAMLHIAELPFYLALLVVLGGRYGLNGYAAAFSLRCLIDCLLLSFKAGVLDRQAIVRVGLSGVIIVAAMVSGQYLDDWQSMLACACVLALFGLVFMVWGLPDNLRQRLGALPVFRSRLGSFVLAGGRRTGSPPQPN